MTGKTDKFVFIVIIISSNILIKKPNMWTSSSTADPHWVSFMEFNRNVVKGNPLLHTGQHSLQETFPRFAFPSPDWVGSFVLHR